MFFIISLIIVGIGIALLHNMREEEEDSLGWKLIGYYILGVFYFSINGFVIPIGFIISLFLKPTQNSGIKRGAAIFGLIMMLIGFLF